MPNDFFKHGDKVYAENLNDGILVGNMFDFNVEFDLPADTEGVFPSGSDTVKVKVADVTPTANSNLTIGETVTNTSNVTQEYRLTVYPDFNRFGGFQYVKITGVGCTLKLCEKGESTEIVSGMNYNDLSNIAQLKTLKEYDIVVNISKVGTLTGLQFSFQSKEKDAIATISIDDVEDLNEELDDLSSALATLNVTKENVANKTNDPSIDSTGKYPSSKALSDGLAAKQNNTIHSITEIGPQGTSPEKTFNHKRTTSGGTITYLFNNNNTGNFAGTLQRVGNLVTFTLAGTLYVTDGGISGQTVVYDIPEGYRPNFTQAQVAMSTWGVQSNVGSVNITSNNEVRMNIRNNWSSIADKTVILHAHWAWITSDDEPEEEE